MDRQPGEERSVLYLLRIWTALDGGGRVAYRGKLQPVLGDDSYGFEGAPGLLALLATLFADARSGEPGKAAGTPSPPRRVRSRRKRSRSKTP